MPCFIRAPGDGALLLRLQNSGIESWNIWIHRAGFKSRDENVACLRRIDDRIDPQARCTVPRIGLSIIGRLDLVIERSPVSFREDLAATFDLFRSDFGESARG